jgi:hypothetical protein
MTRFYRFLHLLLLACVMTGVAACSSPLDTPRKAALEARARQAAAGDMALQTKPDLGRPAFFEVDYESQRTQTLRQPVCGGYCLRLLYSGEAKTVISGFAIPRDRDCAALQKAAEEYHEDKIKTLGFTSRDWTQLDACERQKKFTDGVTATDPPRLWRGDAQRGPSYLVWARAYHIEKRASCPGTLHADTLRGYPNVQGNSPLPDADAAADKTIAAGQCLIETPVDVDTATSVFLFSFENADNNDKNSPMRDTTFSSYQLTVYGAAAAGRPVIYRHTVSDYAFLPALAPAAYFDSASFYVQGSSEPKSLLDHLRSDIGLKLADVSVAQVDLGEAVAHALDNPDLDFTSPNWNIVSDYLAALKGKGPGTLDAGDARLIARLIADRRVTVQLRDLADIVKANPQAGATFAAPLLTAMNTFPYKASPDGYAQLLGNDEERSLLARQGGNNRDLLNAGLDRLDFIAAGLAALDDDSVRTQLPLYRRVVDDRYRIQLYPTLVEHMNLLAPGEALPVLHGLVTASPEERQWQSFQDARRLSAFKAACRMGDAGAPLLPDAVAFLKTASAPENNGDNAGSAEIAWTILAHFHQADALAAQLHPAKPYMELMASRRLNCHGWLYPPTNGDIS